MTAGYKEISNMSLIEHGSLKDTPSSPNHSYKSNVILTISWCRRYFSHYFFTELKCGVGYLVVHSTIFGPLALSAQVFIKVEYS